VASCFGDEPGCRARVSTFGTTDDPESSAACAARNDLSGCDQRELLPDVVGDTREGPYRELLGLGRDLDSDGRDTPARERDFRVRRLELISGAGEEERPLVEKHIVRLTKRADGYRTCGDTVDPEHGAERFSALHRKQIERVNAECPGLNDRDLGAVRESIAR